MGRAHRNQSLQDRITQQWVILFGKKIDPKKEGWLMGPVGGLDGIGQKFIEQLARKEGLEVDIQRERKGLILSIDQLNLSGSELNKLSKDVIDFYENTAQYDLKLHTDWNPFFKVFGLLLRAVFSRRIEQLNVPIRNSERAEDLSSEIVQLVSPDTHEVKRTIWLRTFKSTGQVVYSGVYSTCEIPSGKSCIKALFPLPNGSATVILSPSVGNKGELILTSSGKRIGDSGFYFLLTDSKGQHWAKYVRTFRDSLVVKEVDDKVLAVQTLTFWGLRVLTFKYQLRKRLG